jgi:hypothetical protein
MNARQEHVNARQVALALKAWAQENHLLETDFPVALAEQGDARDVLFDSLALTALSERILRQRAMNAIAFNEATNEVVVFTSRKITQQELKVLPSAILQEVSVKYIQGGIAHAGAPAGGSAHGPYSLHNGKYTCGSSIHPARALGAGTIGCLVTSPDGTMYGLSNNHVSGMCNYSFDGEKILAPGHNDITANGMDPFTIGYHTRALPMNHGVPDNIDITLNNDVALFKIADVGRLTSMQGLAFDTPANTFALMGGQTVEKIGRTTGHSTGIVMGQMTGAFPVSYTVPGLGTHQAYFENIFVIQGTNDLFSQPGDSGSLITTVLNGERFAVGLLFAGDQAGLSYALPLMPILTTLNVSLVSNHNV